MTMTIPQAVNIFLNDRSTFCAPASVSYYAERLDSFYLWSTCCIDKYEDLNEDVLQSYLRYLRNHNLKATSIHNYFRAIYTFINFMEDERNMQHIKKIRLPKPDPAIILPLSAGEVKKLLDSLHLFDQVYYLRNHIIIRLMLDCGLRSSEVRNLKRSDVQIGSNCLLVQLSKCEKSRMLPLPSDLRDLILDLPYSSSVFLLTDCNGEQLSKNAIKMFFQKLKYVSNIPRVHAHLLRHTFASSYMFYKGNIEFCRLYMGHSSYDVTQKYVNISNQCLMTDYDIYRIPDCFK